MRPLFLPLCLVVGCTGVASLPSPEHGTSPAEEVVDPSACAPPPARLRRLTPLQLEATLEAGLRVDDGQSRPAFWQPLRNRFTTTAGIIGALQPSVPETELFSHEAKVEAATPLFFSSMVGLSASLSTQALTRLDPCIAAGADDTCVSRLISEVGARLFRRPLASDEQARFMNGFSAWARTMPRREAVALTLRRLTLESLGAAAPLVEDALAREVEAWAAAKNLERARVRASEFVTRYPTSYRRATVERAAGLVP